jgi:hypothetical protein
MDDPKNPFTMPHRWRAGIAASGVWSGHTGKHPRPWAQDLERILTDFDDSYGYQLPDATDFAGSIALAHMLIADIEPENLCPHWGAPIPAYNEPSCEIKLPELHHPEDPVLLRAVPILPGSLSRLTLLLPPAPG